MLKVFFDFLPIGLFFIAYRFVNLMVATQVAILASLVQLVWLRISSGRFQKVNVISFLSILLLGGATLLFKDEIFVKWKPTVVYWLLSIFLAGSHFFTKKPIMQRVAESSFRFPDRIWRKINLSWSGFFLILGVINLYVVYNYSTSTWVNFKLFGTLGITLVFVVLQSIFMAKHAQFEGES